MQASSAMEVSTAAHTPMDMPEAGQAPATIADGDMLVKMAAFFISLAHNAAMAWRTGPLVCSPPHRPVQAAIHSIRARA